jgi:hypothetical protein
MIMSNEMWTTLYIEQILIDRNGKFYSVWDYSIGKDLLWLVPLIFEGGKLERMGERFKVKLSLSENVYKVDPWQRCLSDARRFF